MTTWTLVKDEAILERVRANWSREVVDLVVFDFHNDYCLREQVFPFSGILMSPVLLVMWLQGEVVKIEGMFRVVQYSYFLIHASGHCYTNLSKTLMKFVSLFDDGTLIVTSTADFPLISESRKYYRFAYPNESTATLWNHHQTKVGEFIRQGLTPVQVLTSEDIQHMEAKQEKMLFRISDKKGKQHDTE